MADDVTINEGLEVGTTAERAETLRLERLDLGAKRAYVVTNTADGKRTLVSVWRSADTIERRWRLVRRVGASIVVVVWLIVPFLPKLIEHLACVCTVASASTECLNWLAAALRAHLPNPVLWFAASLPGLIAVEKDLLSTAERFAARRAAVEKVFTRQSTASRFSARGEDLETYRPSIGLMLASALALTVVFCVAGVLSDWKGAFASVADSKGAASSGPSPASSGQAPSAAGAANPGATPSATSYATSAAGGAVFAAVGAYANTLYLMTHRLNSSAVTPIFLLNAAVRAMIAMSFGGVLAHVGATSVFTGASGIVYFLIGFFPSWAVGAFRNKAKELFAPDDKGCDSLPLCLVDGLDDGIIDRLAEAGIWDIQHLATARPHEIIMRTLYPPYRVLDWLDQANLITYVRRAIPEFRSFGIRGAIDMRALYGDFAYLDDSSQESATARGTRAKEILDALAQKTSMPLSSLCFIGGSLHDDALVLFILDLWFQDTSSREGFGDLRGAVRSAVTRAAKQGGLAFEPDPKADAALAIPTEPAFGAAFEPLLRHTLAAWGLGWTGTVADFANAKTWDDVFKAIAARITFSPPTPPTQG